MLELPTDLPADLVPLSWLIGVWEGTGIIEYPRAGGLEHFSGEFAHRVSFSHDGTGALNYSASAWLQGDDGQPSTALVAETGFWRLSRPAAETDPGPGLLPPVSLGKPRTVEDVEALRLENGGFAIEALVAQADGALELYLGTVDGPRIDLVTDAVVRSSSARPAAASSRMYGLVDGFLLWAWDIATSEVPLRSHASARLAKV